MTWLTPTLATIAAAIAVPTLLLLYFLKLRRRDVEVSTTLLWKRAIQDLQANAPFQRIRRNILLILQLIVLGAALAALGQPQTRGDTQVGSRHIILIDRSASMQTRDEEGTPPVSRLDAARKQALALVESLREPTILQKDRADQAMVISFDASARVVQNFTSDKGLLRAAINAIEPADTPTSIALAIQLAKAQSPTRMHVDRDGSVTRVEGLTEGPTSVIHVWTDGRIADVAEANPGPGEQIVFNRVGKPETGNVALVGLRSERAFDLPARLSVYAGIESTEPADRALDVELLLDGQVAMIRPVTLPAARTAIGADPARPVTPSVGGVVFTLEREQGALAQVRLRTAGGDLADDPLDVDNRAWLVVPPAKRLAVALVTRDNLFLKTALEGMPLARLTVLTPAQYQAAIALGKSADHDVVILDAWAPPLDPARAPIQGALPPTGLPPGRFLVLGAVPGGADGYQLVEREPTGAQSLLDWRRDHPVLRGLLLDAVAIAQARAVAPAEGAGVAVIASADHGPAMLEVADERSRALVVTFVPTDSNWPLNWSFIVFLAQAVTYLGDDQAITGAGQTPRLVQPGEIIRDRVPPGVPEVEVTTPAGLTHKVQPAADGQVVFGPITTVGPYRLAWSGPAETPAARLFAANLLDSAESDVAASAELALATAAVGATTAQATLDRKLWPWLILAALGLLMIEWFVYNRKVHV
ncbi:MAG: VWA domain-containing protein [Phycisphaerae bacterium]|nr:VWA domain-containing protein [Phycisphaerae bacterium]